MLKRTLGLFLSNFHLDKYNRKIHRKKVLDDYTSRQLKKLKFGVSYSVFTGYELLEQSIKQLRSQVQYINIVYQRLSYHGKPLSEGYEKLEKLIFDLKNNGLVDEVILYEGFSEIEKRNIGLKAAKKAGVKYFMTMDCDEFYIPEEVEKAKKYILQHKISRSAVPYFNYSISPNYRDIETVAFVPFFSKISYFTKLKKPNRNNPCTLDPTRVTSFSKYDLINFIICGMPYRFYIFNDTIMHHMHSIRNNISDKFLHSSYQYDFIDGKLVHIMGGGSEHQRILEDVAKIRNKKPITTKHVVVVDKFNIKI